MVFVMLNPSTADERTDDQTVRRCRHFAQREGHSSLTIVNLFPVIVTNPADLMAHPRPLGPLAYNGKLANDLFVRQAVSAASTVVIGWGSSLMGWPTARVRVEAVLAWMEAKGVRYRSLGWTVSGHPRHPSRLPNAAPLWGHVPAGAIRRPA
jgi:hypothetical protein